MLIHLEFYAETKMARIMNDTTLHRYFGPGNTNLM